MVITWPTVLTLGRLMAAPAIGLSFLVLPRPLADGLSLALFLLASATDWLDGVLARRSGQVTRLGTMLDPIADKAMVILSLTVLVGLYGMIGWILLPALLIIFREVFVSGLREYLGDVAGTLAVTPVAKLKTAVQMTAIALLLFQGFLGHHLGMRIFGMGEEMAGAVFSGEAEDVVGLKALDMGARLTWYSGVALLWVAALLTLVSGWDYFAKARPHLTETAKP